MTDQRKELEKEPMLIIYNKKTNEWACCCSVYNLPARYKRRDKYRIEIYHGEKLKP